MGWAHMTCRGVSYHDDAAYASEQLDRQRQPGCRAERLPETHLRADRRHPPDRPQRRHRQDVRRLRRDSCQVDLRANIGSFCPRRLLLHFATGRPNLVVIGGHVTDNVSTDEPSGVIRAFDVHTGKLVWNWDSGNPDDTTPLAEGKTYTRNSPNMWSMFSVDENPACSTCRWATRCPTNTAATAPKTRKNTAPA